MEMDLMVANSFSGLESSYKPFGDFSCENTQFTVSELIIFTN